MILITVMRFYKTKHSGRNKGIKTEGRVEESKGYILKVVLIETVTKQK